MRPGPPQPSPTCYPTGCACSAPDHPDALITRHNLAYSRGEAREDVGAAALADLLPGRVRMLDPDHPHTLAHWRRQAVIASPVQPRPLRSED